MSFLSRAGRTVWRCSSLIAEVILGYDGKRRARAGSGKAEADADSRGDGSTHARWVLPATPSATRAIEPLSASMLSTTTQQRWALWIATASRRRSPAAASSEERSYRL